MFAISSDTASSQSEFKNRVQALREKITEGSKVGEAIDYSKHLDSSQEVRLKGYRNLTEAFVGQEIFRMIKTFYSNVGFEIDPGIILAKVLNSGEIPIVYVVYRQEEAKALRKLRNDHELKIKQLIRAAIKEFVDKEAKVAQRVNSTRRIDRLAFIEEEAVEKAQQALLSIRRKLGNQVTWDELPKIVFRLKQQAGE